MIDIPLHTKVEGRFKLEAVKVGEGGAVVSRRPLTGWFSNLITDAGLSGLFSSTDSISRCHVGSGSAEPAPSDTQLVAHVATTPTKVSDTGDTSTESPYGTTRTVRYRFAEGAAAGNLSEIGVSPANDGPLFSRTLIKDAEGNPTTITVQSDESLDVTYTLTAYPPQDTVTKEIEVDGVPTTVRIRAAYAGHSSYWGNLSSVASLDGDCAVVGFPGESRIGPITARPTPGTQISGAARAAPVHVPGNFYADYTVESGLADHNGTGGLGAIVFGRGGSSRDIRQTFQADFTPPIPKTPEKKITWNFRVSVGRVD